MRNSAIFVTHLYFGIFVLFSLIAFVRLVRLFLVSKKGWDIKKVSIFFPYINSTFIYLYMLVFTQLILFYYITKIVHCMIPIGLMCMYLLTFPHSTLLIFFTSSHLALYRYTPFPSHPHFPVLQSFPSPPPSLLPFHFSLTYLTTLTFLGVGCLSKSPNKNASLPFFVSTLRSIQKFESEKTPSYSHAAHSHQSHSNVASQYALRGLRYSSNSFTTTTNSY